jgi:hypothetical protein
MGSAAARRFMKKRRRALWVIAAFLLVVAMVAFYVRSFGHSALGAYMNELRSKGERLTIRELSATYSPATNDTFSELTNVVAKLGLPPADVTNFHAYQFAERSQVA